ncbi:hypothetical protein [Magnetospirillum fulvum]|uniref:Uncharacterized protein n=1 Tax=Magnetospirillum fulvum MGU-K5 TaxID=1316936 RepID=S9SFI2_MAGFU|nr:hypothetical protein [Magnetospirillum fulvum]EPY03499.1 hypothetical protein K678_00270 [Magnetospirillum fulvum MGU-K5]
MCMGGGGSTPSVPTQEPPKEPVKLASTQVQQASDTTRKQLAAAGSTMGGTLLTGGQGVLGQAETSKKTLLGG